jgi:hypothetical protein
MNRAPDLDLVLREYLAEDGLTAPDYVLDVVEDRIGRQPQRRTWRLDRRPNVTTTMKLALAAAATIVISFAAWNLIPRPSSPVGPAPSASATPLPTPSPGPISLTGESWDELEPGAYVHDQSIPAVTFEVPDGWWLTSEVPWGFGIRPEAYSVDEGIRAWWDMRATRNDPDCPEAADPAIGHRAADLIAEFTTRPGISATAPRPISIGGLDGQWTDLTLDPAWTGTCPFDTTKPGVTLFTDADPTSGEGTPFWGISTTEHLRVIALDDTNGSNVLIVLTGTDAQRFDAMVAAVMPVVESFEFATAP